MTDPNYVPISLSAYDGILANLNSGMNAAPAMRVGVRFSGEADGPVNVKRVEWLALAGWLDAGKRTPEAAAEAIPSIRE